MFALTMTEIEVTLEALLFGEMWYFGILIFIVLALCIVRIWKYAGVLIIPFIIVFEVQYFDRVSENQIFVWPMFILIVFAFMVAFYAISEATS